MAIKRINYEKTHSYSIDGKKAIGVTTALSDGVPKPALTSWAAKCVARHVVDMGPEAMLQLFEHGRDFAFEGLKKVPWLQLNKAAERGTKVHDLAEKLVFGDGAEVPPELCGHVESVIKFFDDWEVTPVLVEKTVGDYAWGYAGTFDLVADVHDGRRILFDYKTSTSGIFPETAMQLAAYRWASHYVADGGIELPMSEVRIDQAKAVWVRADGYDVIPLNTGRDVFEVFLHALGVARAKESMKAWLAPAEDPNDYLNNLKETA